jgi:deazaflavin-dependent oxidoreductase (nitroreductase family)
MAISESELETLASTLTVDLTTIGRRSGEPRTIEIWWFHVDDRFIITGTPGRRDWLANVRANPNVVVSLGDRQYSGAASEVDDPAFRQRVFTDPKVGWYQTQADLAGLVDAAPMIEVILDAG